VLRNCKLRTLRAGNFLLVNFRHFAPATAAIDTAWCESASSGDQWKPTGLAWGTNNGPIQLENPTGIFGVQKPGDARQLSNPHTAATEKIVADLAYCLGLPVPPVTLWDRGASAGAPRLVCVSAWAFEQALQWGQADPGLTQPQRDALLPVASAMMPFESWISAQDRQNPGNVLIGLSPAGEIAGAWIDYAFSLDHVWRGNLVAGCAVCPLYPAVGNLAPEMVKITVDRISSLDDGVIKRIINRIPADYLPRAVADNVIKNLLARRADVTTLLHT
jgi:hypothetical protein